MFGWEKKKEKERKIDLAFERVTREIKKIDEWADPKKIERYILDSCEQIVGTTKEIEADKKEYRRITAHLDDIAKIEALSEDEAKELKKAAKKIEELHAARRKFETENRLIDDEMFEIISENEEEMPQTVERMMENEAYQDSVKKNMRILEGEKDRYQMEREEHDRRKKRLRLYAVLLMVSLGVLFLLLFIIEQYVSADLSWIVLLFILAISVFATLLFVRLSASSRGNKKARKKYNETVALLNSVRIRYANVTKALQYVQEKYHVRSAHELSYLWNQYQAELRRQAKFLQDNKDLEYYTLRFNTVLDELELYQKEIWRGQTKAIIDPAEMARLKHDLIDRRKKNREHMAESTRAVKSERDEIDRLMFEHNYYVPEIMEVIETVDRICGLSTKATESAPKKTAGG